MEINSDLSSFLTSPQLHCQNWSTKSPVTSGMKHQDIMLLAFFCHLGVVWVMLCCINISPAPYTVDVYCLYRCLNISESQRLSSWWWVPRDLDGLPSTRLSVPYCWPTQKVNPATASHCPLSQLFISPFVTVFGVYIYCLIFFWIFFLEFAAFTFCLFFGYGLDEGSQWVCIAPCIPWSRV